MIRKKVKTSLYFHLRKKLTPLYKFLNNILLYRIPVPKPQKEIKMPAVMTDKGFIINI